MTSQRRPIALRLCVKSRVINQDWNEVWSLNLARSFTKYCESNHLFINLNGGHPVHFRLLVSSHLCFSFISRSYCCTQYDRGYWHNTVVSLSVCVCLSVCGIVATIHSIQQKCLNKWTVTYASLGTRFYNFQIPTPYPKLTTSCTIVVGAIWRLANILKHVYRSVPYVRFYTLRPLLLRQKLENWQASKADFRFETLKL